MKKPLLVVGMMMALGGAGCGNEIPSDTEGTPEALEPATSTLTTQNCTQLTPASVIAKGHDGNVPQNTLDDRLDTRWSNLGQASWLDYDLGTSKAVAGAAIAWHLGNTRTNNFTISVSPDGQTYTQVYSGRSSGTTTAAETYTFPSVTTRRVRITVNGNSLNDWASIAEARPCAGTQPTPPPSPSPAVWRGDFETGNLSQYSKTQSMAPDRLQVVQSPVREGRYALRAEVRRGDDPINASGNRNELVKFDGASEGTEFYYGWSTLWPSDYPMTPNWQVFMQWHHPGASGAPPVRFVLGCSAADCGKPMPDTLFFIVNGKTVWTKTPVTRGGWHDFVLHIKWSANASAGFVELWYDGELVLPKRYTRTMFSSSDVNYLKMGLYRDEAIQPTAVLFHDGLVQAKTLEGAVQPALPGGSGLVAAEAP
ncbi:heparin lyase I family protein [Archangium lansingense]|uniref:heparin lyase I family protein n=1 Tax=Archangium lansingense TaxID=2995310 RepID=UPI003B801EBB